MESGAAYIVEEERSSCGVVKEGECGKPNIPEALTALNTSEKLRYYCSRLFHAEGPEEFFHGEASSM